MREVDERTRGNVKLGPGTLYGSIKRMMADGLIEELEERLIRNSTTSAAGTIA